MFTDKTKNAICAVASDCAVDMGDGASDAEAVAETAMDACRLTTWGYPEADKEVSALIQQHGYPAVLKAAAEFVPTA